MESRKPYPSDVPDEEWAFVAPYLALVREDAPQRDHALREVFNMLYGGCSEPERSGGCLLTTFHPGRRSTSRLKDGLLQEYLRRWWQT